MAMPPTEPGSGSVTEPPVAPLRGEENASRVIETIYRSEAGNLTRYFGRSLRGADEASDYVHEVFARLIRTMSARPILQPQRYLRRIARNLLFERTRRLKTQPPFHDIPFSTGLEVPTASRQSHRIEYDDMLKTYRLALDELPSKTRQVFLLHRVDELAYREIGDRLGISIPTVQYHMARALAHIDAALGQE